MSVLVHCLTMLALFLGGVAQAAPPAPPAAAKEAPPAIETAPVRLGPDVSYQFIGRWEPERLNEILATDAPKFFSLKVTYTPARNAVLLYRVTYSSVIPERDNRPTTATGLLAIPEGKAASYPLLSYQHGTVYGKQDVPSFPDQSPETQLILAQFAGQGYAVIGADYFGMGQSQVPEGYLVKKSHQQASFDMLTASRAILEHMKIATPKLYLGGWSQGGFVTMALLERLEAIGVPVAAAATASAPIDGAVVMNGFLNFPRPTDAGWVPTLFILTAFSFEHYYGMPGLARSVIREDAFELARKVYEREPYDPAEIPTDLHKLVRADYFDARFFAASAYGRLLSDTTHAYRWVIRSPVRNYYGEADEVITPGVGRLAMIYQRAMGRGNMQVEAISTGDTDHRGTFAKSVPLWKAWFEGR